MNSSILSEKEMVTYIKGENDKSPSAEMNAQVSPFYFTLVIRNFFEDLALLFTRFTASAQIDVHFAGNDPAMTSKK